jgi:hypothetical protein
MPLVNVLIALVELESEQLLVDLEGPVDHSLSRKVLLQGLLVHRVLGLLDHVGVVAHVPEVQVAVDFVVKLFALEQKRTKFIYRKCKFKRDLNWNFSLKKYFEAHTIKIV